MLRKEDIKVIATTTITKDLVAIVLIVKKDTVLIARTVTEVIVLRVIKDIALMGQIVTEDIVLTDLTVLTEIEVTVHIPHIPHNVYGLPDVPKEFGLHQDMNMYVDLVEHL